jgi:hypothetical protein
MQCLLCKKLPVHHDQENAQEAQLAGTDGIYCGFLNHELL